MVFLFDFVFHGTGQTLDMDWVQNLKKATGRRQLLNRFFFLFLKRNIITYEKRERDGQTGFPPPTWQCCQPLLRDDDYYGPLRANFGKALASGFWGPRLALARWTTHNFSVGFYSSCSTHHVTCRLPVFFSPFISVQWNRTIVSSYWIIIFYYSLEKVIFLGGE